MFTIMLPIILLNIKNWIKTKLLYCVYICIIYTSINIYIYIYRFFFCICGAERVYVALSPPRFRAMGNFLPLPRLISTPAGTRLCCHPYWFVCNLGERKIFFLLGQKVQKLKKLRFEFPNSIFQFNLEWTRIFISFDRVSGNRFFIATRIRHLSDSRFNRSDRTIWTEFKNTCYHV